MKKVFLFLAIAVASLFSNQAYAAKETITDNEKISKIINEYYPALKDYYNAGLMEVKSLEEETLFDGSTEYDVKYRFVKNTYEPEEIDTILKEQFPRVYYMNKAGIIRDVCVYQFVDKESGEIVTDVSYNRNAPSFRLF